MSPARIDPDALASKDGLAGAGCGGVIRGCGAAAIAAGIVKAVGLASGAANVAAGSGRGAIACKQNPLRPGHVPLARPAQAVPSVNSACQS
jgi:hypothetical protein